MDNLLFVNGNKLVSHTSMNSQLQRRLINLGIFEKGLSTHSLRHTFATRCIESGMQAIVLSKLLGHSDVRVTLNTYVKIFNEYQAKASKEVELYYKNLDLLKEDINRTYNIIKEDNQQRSAKIIQFPKMAMDDCFDR